MLKTTSQLIIDEAEDRGWKTEILDSKRSFIRIWDDNGKEYLLRSNTSFKTPAVNYLIALHKPIVYQLATEQGIAVPETTTLTDMAAAKNFLKKHGQIVIKPVDGAHGNGVSTHITQENQLEEAIAFAKRYSSTVLLQSFINGDDYRLLFIDGELAAAAVREPASVVGDGQHTIQELIELENKNPERGKNYTKKLNFISTPDASRFLGDRMNITPADGEKITVVGTANMGKGGRAIDVTDDLDERMVNGATDFIQSLGLPLCGVDFIYDKSNPKQPPVLIEINGTPSFGLHESPSEGGPRKVTKKFLDWLTKPAE